MEKNNNKVCPLKIKCKLQVNPEELKMLLEMFLSA